jgi:hypothetical protein
MDTFTIAMSTSNACAVNLLLYTHFSGKYYVVIPQNRPKTAPSNTVDFVVTYKSKPVFFVEVKPRSKLESNSGRADADRQMRIRIHQLFPNCPLPALYGFSVFGYMTCIFRHLPDSNAVEPPLIRSSSHYITDVAPYDRWKFDIRNSSDSKFIMDVLDAVKEPCGAR